MQIHADALTFFKNGKAFALLAEAGIFY